MLTDLLLGAILLVLLSIARRISELPDTMRQAAVQLAAAAELLLQRADDMSFDSDDDFDSLT